MGLFNTTYFGKKKRKKKLSLSGIKPELKKGIDQDVGDNGRIWLDLQKLQKQREKMSKAVSVDPATGDRKYWGDFKKALRDSVRKKKQ